jgi:hypothetical protein
VPLEEHVEELRSKSTLCAQLASLYDGLKADGLANLTLNDDIDLSVLLHTELFDDIGPYSPTSALQHTHLHVDQSNQLSARSAYDRHASTMQKRQLAPPYDGNRLDLARLTSRLSAGLLDGPARHLDIAPWQTLLPLQDPEEMLKEVDEDNLLARFLELMSPT